MGHELRQIIRLRLLPAKGLQARGLPGRVIIIHASDNKGDSGFVPRFGHFFAACPSKTWDRRLDGHDGGDRLETRIEAQGHRFTTCAAPAGERSARVRSHDLEQFYRSMTCWLIPAKPGVVTRGWRLRRILM